MRQAGPEVSKVPCAGLLHADVLMPHWLQGDAHRVDWIAGFLDAMLQIPKRDCMHTQGLAQLSGPIEEVLQDYKARAVASGQTFERVIRLEAAVLGW